jgi:hypothetical protein
MLLELLWVVDATIITLLETNDVVLALVGSRCYYCSYFGKLMVLLLMLLLNIEVHLICLYLHVFLVAIISSFWLHKFLGLNKSHLPLEVLASLVSRFEQINFHSNF